MVVFHGAYCYSSDQYRDSLYAVIANAPHDTVSIAAYVELGKRYRGLDQDLARKYYFMADSLAQRAGTALQKITIYSGLGRVEAIAGNQTEALHFFNLALNESADSGNRIEQAHNLVNLGIINKQIGNYPQSQELYLMALEIFTDLQDLEGLSRTYQNLGVVTDLSKQPDKAMEYYNLALKIEQQMGKTNDLASIRNNMAIIESKKQNLVRAIDLMKKAIALGRQNNDSGAISPYYINMGNFLIENKQFHQALNYLDTASQLLKRFPDLIGETNLYMNYTQAWMGLKEYEKALMYSTRSVELAKKAGGFKNIAEAWNFSSQLHEQKGDYQTALSHYQYYKSYNDSLYNQNTSQMMANYQVQLDVFSKNQRIAEQEIEMLNLSQTMVRERRLMWLFLIIAALSVMLVYLLVQKFRNSKKVNLKLQDQNKIISQQKDALEKAHEQLEQRLLRSQLNPHFVFNALSSIQQLVTSGEKQEALGYLSRFSRLLRQILDSSVGETSVLLADEIKMLKAYIDLEALRFGNSFTYTLETDPQLDPHSYEVPALLVQPLIENAIIHGLLPSGRKRELTVHFSLVDDMILCTITDNGIGREKASKLKILNASDQQSHGVNITLQRINNVSHTEGIEPLIYRDLYDENNQPAGTEVRVLVPVVF